MREFSIKNSSCCLFPKPNLYLTTSNREYTRIHPSSCKFKLPINEELELEDYFYVGYGGKLTSLQKHKYNKLPYEQSVFKLEGIGFNLENKQFLNERQVGFEISAYSEFWFEKIRWTTKIENNDNYSIAINNTPRFNSFLRDLKSLWTEQMDGKFEVDFNWYGNLNDEGILIKNQIIYQEDVENSSNDFKNQEN